MSLETRRQARSPYKSALTLPPPFRQIALREVGNAFDHAMRVAAEEGAGTLVHVGRFDLVEFAVVLEPEEPLRSARRAVYAGLNAIVDALVAHAPPEKIVNVDWPAAIFVDGGLVGGGRLGWPVNAAEDAVPPWLVFGAMVRVVAMEPIEPGLRPLGSATLEEEGFEELGPGLVESFARHFMVALDGWREFGFAEVAKNYLSRLQPRSGMRREIDGNGDLIERAIAGGQTERKSLIEALAAESWFDPQAGGPRL
jgi:hypothetical protein